MSKYSLIPGLESFMEDTEVNVEVAVGEPDEVAEEVVETSEAAEETGAVAEEAEATDEQTEMILAQFAQLEHRYNHVKKYGVDRTFMRLFNSNGEMERAFRISLPSCESFDATGDKMSPESKAVLAGLEASLSGIWEFIKNLCAKVARFFGRIIDFVRTRFGNVDKQIGRLKEFLKDRKDDPEAVKDVDRKVYSLDDIKKGKDLIQKAIKVNSDGIVSITGYEKLETLNKQLADKIESRKGQLMPPQSEDKKEIEEFNRLQKEAKSELKKVKSDFADSLKENTSLSAIPFDRLNDYLAEATKLAIEHKELTQCCEKKKMKLKHIEQLANSMSARKEAAAAAEQAYASAMSKGINFGLNVTNTYANAILKCAMACIGTCAARARYSTKV